MSWRLSRAAEDDLVAIYVHGLRAFGAEQADAYHDAFERVFTLLATQPALARERSEIDPPVRVHPCGAHIVVYAVDPAGDVLIVRVRHGREDWIADPYGEAS